MKAAELMTAWTLALVAGCTPSDPEAEIRALLVALEQAAEERNAGSFADAIAEGYRDTRGNDRDEALRALRGYFIANQRIDVVSRIDEIVLEGSDAARAVVHAGMVGRRAGTPLVEGLDADLYRFELELVKDSGDWHIIGASFDRAFGE